MRKPKVLLTLAFTMVTFIRAPVPATEEGSVARCLEAVGSSNQRAQWSSLEDRHRWREAAAAGLPVASRGVRCVTNVSTEPNLAQFMITPLQWAVLAGIDAYRAGDVDTVRTIGIQYFPIAKRYRAMTGDSFDLAAYKHITLYLSDFSNGKCAYSLCSQKNYP